MTPLMQQYWEIKSLHQDKILMFRMGDFYEMFYDDATKAAPILGIALTQRNKKSEDETPMCGMPHHSVAGPINKLLKAGLRVAICDQIEDPKTAKGIVKRAVTRILTPGMVYDPDTLEQNQSNYIASYADANLSCVDTSTGENFYFTDVSLRDLQRLLSLLPIVELVLSTEQDEQLRLGIGDDLKKDSKKILPTYLLISHHDVVLDMKPLFMQHNISLSLEHEASHRLFSYVYSLGGIESLKTLKPMEQRALKQKMDLSSTVLRHLEIFSTYRGEGEGSLFFATDRTKTSAGARLLRQWLSFPLIDKKEILLRQQDVQKWYQNPSAVKKLREILGKMGDIERRLSKISQPQCNARDLLALEQSIQAGTAALAAAQIAPVVQIENKSETETMTLDSFRHITDLATEISQTIVDEPPLQIKQGHLIRKGYSPELDELITLSSDSQSLLQKMEEEEKNKTGISSLKIRYNNVFGYYIEVTHTHKDKVPSYYMRKQTLTTAERYCTDELIELEKKVLSSQSRRAELEHEIFNQLKQKCMLLAQELLRLASQCSYLDVISSLSWLALERKYVAPQFSTDGTLKLLASRHPVVEQTVKSSFVANDIEIKPHGCLLLTGPNMAGKSTIMRQVALTAILAQIGSYVPADQALLPLFDHVFTRIGASDQLSEGLSTFMVEMTETADMLEKSSHRSLLILDEIGRGTSTYDGMSLAQAILEFLLTQKRATTLFATHYHELTALSGRYPLLQNAHMAISEKNGEIRFLHTLVSGAMQKSYGIQVAQLAGLPQTITRRAGELLRLLEKEKHSSTPQMSLLDFSQAIEQFAGEDSGPFLESSVEHDQHQQLSEQNAYQDSLAEINSLQEKIQQLETILREVGGFPLNQKTPIEAVMTISQWQQSLEKINQSH